MPIPAAEPITDPNPEPGTAARGFSSPEMGAIAHLYRGEVYRSTIWRTRLDNTTNWAVVTTGLALSISFSSAEASPLPLILVGLLVVVFLLLEARRYRYFNVWRARCRLMETDIFSPMLRGEGVTLDGRWNRMLSDDYLQPKFHIPYVLAVGRRLRKNYGYILAVQAVSYYGKLAIHPEPIDSLDALFARAAVGPIPGLWVVLAGLAFHSAWIGLAVGTWRMELHRRSRTALIAIA
ncbi:DUF2270 domain-containing protein [Paralimibaculum aggregatum]|uniref:DUF2270 domain-containing protein n=1 Tax=Paralimibaculum aggregatum TaxID=3036245 RepID=A0ABQ6LQK8_9RHOB|nr:DUF2270 domain-containing protein [Limibaculum sp. NKW23]GMG82885.1 DUF2270 domain-containing protein [Limibaculum sp. NKW23]